MHPYGNRMQTLGLQGDRAESNRRQTDSQSVSGNQHRTRPQRKERESNSQGTCARTRPASNRLPSPFGLPFRMFARGELFLSSSTRIRTRPFQTNTGLGRSEDDLRFTIEPCQRGVSGRHGIRTHMPAKAHALAVRSGQPYPATFRSFVVFSSWPSMSVSRTAGRASQARHGGRQ